MKHCISFLTVIALGCGLTACDDNATIAPSGTSTASFTATLLPANEVPSITGSEAGGSGTGTITFNLTKDAGGNITAATLDVTATVTGFPAGTALTAAHLHSGAAGVNGGILVSFGLAPGEVTFATGSGSFTKSGVTMTVDQANSILANPSSFYCNIHTAANPGGVARGQLTRTQ